MKKRIAIIGGGISGLATAHRLLELDGRGRFEVLLIEASSRLGGTIRTSTRDGFLLEGGPDSFISEKPEAIELAKRTGLASHLIETNPIHRRSFIVRGGRLRTVPQGFRLLAPSLIWPFIKSDVFSWQGKARMLMELAIPRRKTVQASTNGIDDESLSRFVERRFGREALERMAQPMIGGIYTADPAHLSLRATMPRFLEMERESRSLIWALRKANRREHKVNNLASGARYNLFLSFEGGMQTLTDHLSARLPKESIRLNTKVKSLVDNKQTMQWNVHLEGDEMISADAVCLALPGRAAASLLRQVDAHMAVELEQIPYASTATINLAYRRDSILHKLDGFGFVVPFVERRATLACTFSSVKFPGRAPKGHTLLRAFVGGALQPEMFELDDDLMIEAVCGDLRELLDIKARPIFTHLERWPHSMAQYHLGHLERIKRINARLEAVPTLQLAGNYYFGTGVPDCIRSGERAAERIVETMKESDHSAAFKDI